MKAVTNGEADELLVLNGGKLGVRFAMTPDDDEKQYTCGGGLSLVDKVWVKKV